MLVFPRLGRGTEPEHSAPRATMRGCLGITQRRVGESLATGNEPIQPCIAAPVDDIAYLCKALKKLSLWRWLCPCRNMREPGECNRRRHNAAALLGPDGRRYRS